MGTPWKNCKVQTKHGHGSRTRGYKPTSEPAYYKAHPIVKPMYAQWINQGRTLRQLAEVVDISYGTIASLNRGAAASLHTLAKLLDFFDMKLAVIPVTRNLGFGHDVDLPLIAEPLDIVEHGAHRPEPKGNGVARKCLRCEDTFISHGKRICKPCTAINEGMGL